MTYKHTIPANRHWAPAGSFGFSAAAVITKLRKAIKLNVPVGYQDESGFHLGVKSGEKEVR